MRSLLLALVITSACRGEPSPESKALTPAVDARPPAGHRFAGSWTRDGVEWRAVVIGKLSAAELRDLARRLHAEHPRVFFDLYDDEVELPKLVAARGDDDVLTPTWRDAHAIGTIAGTVGVTNGQVAIKSVQLYEWKTGQSTPLP